MTRGGGNGRLSKRNGLRQDWFFNIQRLLVGSFFGNLIRFDRGAFGAVPLAWWCCFERRVEASHVPSWG